MLGDDYQAEPHLVDFVNATDETRLKINQWTEKQTREKIKNLIPPGSLSPMTRLVLTNAIYFNALWETPFPEDATHREKFWVSPDKSIDVDMMRLKYNFGYFEDENVQVVTLPYKGKEFSMIVILPRQKNGLMSIENMLTHELIQSWFSAMRNKKMILNLPKFKLEFSVQLNQSLSAMGMTRVFTDQADLTGISEDPLYISAVIHKAFIDVHEKGTEAAAATAVLLEMTSAVQPPKMTVDHPFLFCIRHNQTNSILFLGRMIEPQIH